MFPLKNLAHKGLKVLMRDGLSQGVTLRGGLLREVPLYQFYSQQLLPCFQVPLALKVSRVPVSVLQLQWSNVSGPTWMTARTMELLPWVHCVLDISLSFFLEDLTKDTPYLTREGKLWGVVHECRFWQKFYHINCCSKCIILFLIIVIYSGVPL